MTANEVRSVYDVLLSAPGMNDEVRIDLKIRRKHLLLLNHILNLPGLPQASELLKYVDAEFYDALKDVGEKFLEKSSLKDFNDKFMSVHQDNHKS